MRKVIDFLIDIGKKGFFHVFFANILFMIAAFGSQLFIAKILSDVDLGYIKIFQSYTQVLSILGGFGFSTSVLVLGSNSKFTLKERLEFLQVAIYSVVPICLLLLGLFLFLNQFNVLTKLIAVKEIFDDFSFVIVFTAISAVITAFLQSARIFKKYSYVVIITKLLSIFIIIIFTHLFGFRGFFQGLWIGLLISLVVNILFVSSYFDINSVSLNVTGFLNKVKAQINIGIHGLGANFFSILSSNLDIILMGYFLLDDSIIGQYSFASIFFAGLSVILSTVVQVVTPYLGKNINDVKITQLLYLKYTKILFFISLVLLFVFYFTLPFFVRFIFDEKFDLGLSFLLLLLGVWFVRLNNSMNVAYFLASGKTKYSNLVNFVNAFLTFFNVYFSLKFFDINTMIIVSVVVNLFVVLISFKLSYNSIFCDVINHNNKVVKKRFSLFL